MRSLFVDMIKYGTVSVIALIVDFGTLLVLNLVFNVNYLMSASVGFTLGLIVNFFLSNERVFAGPRIKNKTVNFAAFALIGVVGLVANDVIIWLCHGVLHLSVFISKCIAVAVVFFWNFLARRQFLYQGHKSENGE